MKTLFILMGIVFALSVGQCFAGGSWGSSGGESFRDGHNPWFIQNTPVVRYCVKMDQEGFSTDPATAEKLIARAIGYWQREFRRIKDVMQTNFDVQVATQRFVRVECGSYKDPTVDLTFQLGYNTLDALQRAYLQDPRKYIGISVRTDYDEENLKARGFIYISSDRGPSRFDSDTVGSASPFIEAPWRYEGLLYRVLVHELGHVFGIPHIGGSVRNISVVGDGKQNTFALMSEEYPEEILGLESYQTYAQLSEPEPFFVPRTEFQQCELSGNARRFFGLRPDQTCVQVRFDINPTEVAVELSSSSGPFGQRARLGLASWKDWDKESSKLNIQLVVQLKLTPRQRVFPLPPGQTRLSLVGAAMFGLDFPLTYQEPGGTNRNLYFRIAPQSYEAIGEVDGRVVLLLNGI